MLGTTDATRSGNTITLKGVGEVSYKVVPAQTKGGSQVVSATAVTKLISGTAVPATGEDWRLTLGDVGLISYIVQSTDAKTKEFIANTLAGLVNGNATAQTQGYKAYVTSAFDLVILRRNDTASATLGVYVYVTPPSPASPYWALDRSVASSAGTAAAGDRPLARRGTEFLAGLLQAVMPAIALDHGEEGVLVAVMETEPEAETV